LGNRYSKGGKGGDLQRLSCADNLRRVLWGERPEYIPVDFHEDDRFGTDPYIFLTHQGASPPEAGGYDLWGVLWTTGQDTLLYPAAHPAPTLEALLAMPFPDIQDPSLWEDARARAEAVRNQAVVIAFLICTLWERLVSLVGLETALVGLARDPDLVSAILERIANWQVACADQFLEVGIEAARVTDDYASQRDLMMKPATWRRVIQPHLARLVAYYRQAGIPVILHSCGNLSRIMDDLVELGFVAFNIQTSANDLVALRQRYGRRFCVWGGVATQLLTGGTPSQVRDAVRWAVEKLGRDGGLILAPDQYMPAPEENLQAFYRAAEEAQCWPLSSTVHGHEGCCREVVQWHNLKR